jgi:hypothetical protein
MKTDRIDFISAYCDRWCERCQFTSRCSAFAAQVAIGMCGDSREGLELALGVPRSVGESGRQVPDWVDDVDNTEPTPQEQIEWDRHQAALEARVDGTSIMKVAQPYSLLAMRWLIERGEALASDDVLVKDALDVVGHDAVLISAKLNRALHGQDKQGLDFDADSHPIQNDANGSAKVALISIGRSETAWRLLAAAIGDPVPTLLADQLTTLRKDVEDAFPDAERFVRPGFDDPAQ